VAVKMTIVGASSWAWAPLVAAAISGAFALVGIAANLATARRDRRAELYAQAFRTALALVEMVYRARRASENMRGVMDRYHQIHEDINFHQGWIEAQSRAMGRAYRRLILRVREATKDSIDDAFQSIESGG
jgi:hypothetical protein